MDGDEEHYCAMKVCGVNGFNWSNESEFSIWRKKRTKLVENYVAPAARGVLRNNLASFTGNFTMQ